MTSKELSTIFSIVLTPCQLLGYWAPLTQNGSETTKSWAVHTLTSHQVSGLRCSVCQGSRRVAALFVDDITAVQFF